VTALTTQINKKPTAEDYDNLKEEYDNLKAQVEVFTVYQKFGVISLIVKSVLWK
jgi:hypothetical protein